MNISTSECSSGCESGWTMYLDQSSNSQENSRFIHHKNEDFVSYNYKSAGVYLDGYDEENEDLSMVSDASSGPPHFGEDDDECYLNEKKRNKTKIKSTEKKSGKKEKYLYLDDTASSPVKVNWQSGMVLPPSGASMEHGTHYKGKSVFQKHIGFFQSSMSKKSSSGAGVLYLYLQVRPTTSQAVCREGSKNEKYRWFCIQGKGNYCFNLFFEKKGKKKQ